jgi:hypothetical protein
MILVVSFDIPIRAFERVKGGRACGISTAAPQLPGVEEACDARISRRTHYGFGANGKIY